MDKREEEWPVFNNIKCPNCGLIIAIDERNTAMTCPKCSWPLWPGMDEWATVSKALLPFCAQEKRRK